MSETPKCNIRFVRAAARGVVDLLVYGELGEWGDVSAKAFADELQTHTGSRVRVCINSIGGDVFAGQAIYSQLRRHRAGCDTVVDGIAASAASIVAMAGERRTMATGAMLMIHNPWTVAMGESEDMRKAADTLDRVRDNLVKIYEERTGMAPEQLQQLLADETWMTAEQALDLGFITEMTDGISASIQQHGDHVIVNGITFPRIARTFKDNIMGQKNDQKTDIIERERCAEITRITQTLGLDMGFAQEAIRNGTDLDAFKNAAIDARAAAHINPINDAGRAYGDERFEVIHGRAGRIGSAGLDSDFRAAASDALLLRAGVRPSKVHPAARDLSGSVHDIARTCLSRAGKTYSGKPAALIKAAHTTSDFPLILSDAMHKSTRLGYEDEPSSHRAWVRTQPVVDFRDQNRPILGSAPELEKVLEAGEYTLGTLDEDATSYRVAKYGRAISLSWELLVNDDLGAFMRLRPGMGQSARRKEADLVYDLLAENSNDGPVMQDGVVLFHSTHKNLASSASAINATSIGAARSLLRKQTGVGGGLLNLVPRYLIVPAERETEAEILLAAATRQMTQNADATERTDGLTPEAVSRLQLVVEARLAATAFYLAADSAQIDTVELGLLEENIGGPVIEEDQEFNRDVYRWKVRHVMGSKVLDWRGLVKVPLS
jgi:ATP-dependent protease ClpP protease subunit